MSELILEYTHHAIVLAEKVVREDFGRLTMSVTTERFSGRGGFWVQWEDVAEFGDRLAAFPIDPNAPLSARWGFRDGEGDDLVLGIRIAPANATGDLLVSVEIGDEHHSSDRVRTSFLTNYPDVERFRQSIRQLMDEKVEQAILTGR